MKVYDKPLAYTLSHIGAGALAFFYPIVFWIFAAYQLLQLALGVRFFGLQREIRVGNNVLHTARKFAEFAAGYLLIWLLQNIWRKNE